MTCWTLILCCLIGLQWSSGLSTNKNEDRWKPTADEKKAWSKVHGEYREGDIFPSKKRNGIRNKHWPNGVIPYEIDSNVAASNRRVLQQAFDYYHQRTCIRFVARTKQNDYLHIQSPHPGVCGSQIGRQGGSQRLELEKSCFGSFGTVLHELMHAVGFFHEQSREDRDNYITIHWENIEDYARGQFDMERGMMTHGTKYDLKSIMHYRRGAFSKNGKDTITPKNGLDATGMGLGTTLSVTDIYEINAMYKSECARGTGSVNCINELKACDEWAKHGECQKNPNYMLKHCQKACDSCPTEQCVNKHKACPSWAAQNPSECEKNPGYMLYNCEKACEVCGARIGCFQQKYLPNGISYASVSMSPNYCKRYCGQRNYKYAGLKNGNACYCANAYGQGPRTADANCQVNCVGRTGFKCGGTNTVEVYDVSY